MLDQIWLDQCIFSILTEDARKARVMERIEKLRAYRNYEIDSQHKLVQHIKYLGALRLVMHLR